MVHACSSCTNPTSLRDWWVLGYQYWSANPAPVKLAPGDYPRPDRRRAPATHAGAQLAQPQACWSDAEEAAVQGSAAQRRRPRQPVSGEACDGAFRLQASEAVF